jgi:osmotically-inducible protein OsmY
MKRITILLLLMAFAGAAFAAQDSTTASKKKGEPADCTKVDDAAITTNVQAALAKSPSLKGFTVNAATSSGVVTLTGGVKTSGQKGAATRAAKRTDCVRSVKNQLTVEAPNPGPKKKESNKQ